ncbi:MAG: hypothetical protein ACREEM_44640 [Blastocatellia bacterium]
MSKPIDQLSSNDLQQHPIWEYAMDEEEDHDETHVRPAVASAISQEIDHNVFHVSCDLIIGNGRRLTGFMSICNGQLHDDAPVAVGEAGQYWPLDDRPNRRNREQFELFFGASYNDIFPVHWRLRVLAMGESENRTGTYHGG